MKALKFSLLLMTVASIGLLVNSGGAFSSGYIPTERYSQYGFGGGGSYDPGLGAQWWRDWDASYNYPPGVGGRPPHKLWTVGKFDNRQDGPYQNNNLPAYIGQVEIDTVFAWEAPIIATRILTDGYTGQVWEIGNEPNLWPWEYSPQLYGYEYDLYCDYIHGLDVTAKCANGGLIYYPGITEWWLDTWFSTYNTPTIDILNIHPYNGSLSATETEWQIATMRSVFDVRGYANSPLWITEFGWGSWQYRDPNEIAAYATHVCTWLNAHHGQYDIERWFWWGVYAGPQGMGSGGLFSGSPYSVTNQTVVGAAYLAARDAPLYSIWMPIFIEDNTVTIPTQMPYP
jgi:hypothetical protein